MAAVTDRHHWSTAEVCLTFERQDGMCGRSLRTGGCGEKLLRPDDGDDGMDRVDRDHIIALEDGGPDTLRNLQLLHSVPCHQRKSGVEATNRAKV